MKKVLFKLMLCLCFLLTTNLLNDFLLRIQHFNRKMVTKDRNCLDTYELDTLRNLELRKKWCAGSQGRVSVCLSDGTFAM